MDLGTILILIIAALLGTNHMLLRLPRWEYRMGVFWTVQFTNLTAVVLLLAIGIPGFAGATKAVNWVLGLLFILHIVTNNGRLLEARKGSAQNAKVDEKREQIKAALQRGTAIEE